MISLKNVTKRYGNITVLDNINVTFVSGKIYGIVGRNGSGKTMLFKCICGFVPVTEGEIMVCEKKIGQDTAILENMGIIIENPGFIPQYSGFYNLLLLSKIKNIIGKKEIERVMNTVGLPIDKKRVSAYSMGMRQRLGIAQAIMENPDILILDEPMNGLDNVGVEDIRKLLLSEKAKGKTILLASHNREDISKLCDKVYEMDNGVITENK